MIYLARIGDTKANFKPHAVILDITVKDHPEHILSPTWKMVLDFKNGNTTWKEYKQQYVELLEERYKTRKGEFLALAEMARLHPVYFRCYCPDENMCHRSLAKRAIYRLISIKIKEEKDAVKR